MHSQPDTSRIKADTIVIGAGPAGLGAALALDDSAIVLESRETVAGLCGTVALDGAIFDLGGHSFSTPHPGIRRLVFDALEMEEQNREAWCWLNGQWVRYPFQQHFSELADPHSRYACQIGLEAANGWQDAANFDEYLDRRFGRGITELFMRPYNRKLWGADLTRLDPEWVSERVAAPVGTAESSMSESGRRLPLSKQAMISPTQLKARTERSSKRWHAGLPISGVASPSRVSTHELQRYEQRMAKQRPGAASFQHFLCPHCYG